VLLCHRCLTAVNPRHLQLGQALESLKVELLSRRVGYKESDSVVQQIALQLRLYIEQSLYNKTLRHNDQGQIHKGSSHIYPIDQNILSINPSSSWVSKERNSRSNLFEHELLTKLLGWVETRNELNLLLRLAFAE
jgi:hypothetical protein